VHLLFLWFCYCHLCCRGVEDLIKINNVTFTYRGEGEKGIENINLEIIKGECILLCGRSGCGKTTLTRLINGLVPHFYDGKQEGYVKVEGMKISDIPMYQISEKVGSVFQSPRTQCFNVDTDSEIAFGIENLSYSLEKLQENIEKTKKDLQVENLLGRSIFELSGGEKQKIAFASIYAMCPDIYILDEPSSNLDVDAIERLRKTLFFLKQQKKTIIIAEHRLYFLKDLADRIIYMDQSKIKGTYTTKKFLSFPVSFRENMGLRTMDLYSVKPTQRKIVKAPKALEIQNLTLWYKKQRVMSDISFKAAGGEVIGIIGHNGAGKSTFSRALCGLHKGCEGTFLWQGKEMNSRQRLKLSYMVMQDVNYQLFAESVERECCFGIKNPDKELAAETMKELGIYEYKNHHPNTLSGGQKQRLAVAVSMICKKEILIFDEPTSGLDFDSMVQVSKLISKISQMGKIIFIVTHDYEFISLICNRVIHFDKGTIKDDFAVNEENIRKLQEFFIVS